MLHVLHTVHVCAKAAKIHYARTMGETDMQSKLQAHHGSHATRCDKKQAFSLSISQQAMRVNMPGLPIFFQDQNRPST